MDEKQPDTTLDEMGDIVDDMGSTYQNLQDTAEKQMLGEFSRSVREYLTHSDMGMGGLAKRTGIDRKKIKAFLNAKYQPTEEESTKITEAITDDSKVPSRQLLAKQRKARIALGGNKKMIHHLAEEPGVDHKALEETFS